MTLKQLETALDRGHISVKMSNGNWWKVRRNGKTQTWKRDTNKFRIPVKVGLTTYGEITNLSDFSETGNFRLTPHS